MFKATCTFLSKIVFKGILTNWWYCRQIQVLTVCCRNWLARAPALSVTLGWLDEPEPVAEIAGLAGFSDGSGGSGGRVGEEPSDPPE